MILNVTSSIIENVASTITPSETDYYNSTQLLKLNYATVNTSTILPQNSDVDSDVFHRYWNLKTVPIYLALMIGPLLCFKSPTFFTKFNSLGKIILIYLLFYIYCNVV